jgi:hypothetical protein
MRKSLKQVLVNPEILFKSGMSKVDLHESTGMFFEAGVEEAAKNVSDARKEKLALWFDHDNDMKTAILVNYPKAKELIREGTNLKEAITSATVGFIRLGKIDADDKKYLPSQVKWEVKLSAANKSWGPLMYDVALGMAYPDYVVSDRMAVSKYAQNIWNYYLKNRPDVERIFLVDEKKFLDPRTPIQPSTRFGFEELEYALPIDIREGTLSPEMEQILDKIPPSTVQFLLDLRENYYAGDYKVVPLPKRRTAEYGKLIAGLKIAEKASRLAGYMPSEALEDANISKTAIANAIIYGIPRALEAVKALYLDALKKEGLAYAYRLKAPTSAKNGPALAALIKNGKKLEAMAAAVNRDNAENTLRNAGDDFFWDKLDN